MALPKDDLKAPTQGFESPQNITFWYSTDIPRSYAEAGCFCLISVSFWQQVIFHTIFLIYMCFRGIHVWVFFKTSYAILIFHVIFLIYVCVLLWKLNKMIFHTIFLIYICAFEAFSCFIFHTIFHIYIYSKNKHSPPIDIPQGSDHRGAWPYNKREN